MQSNEGSGLAEGPGLGRSEPEDLRVQQPLGPWGAGVIVAAAPGGEGGQQGTLAAQLSIGEDCGEQVWRGFLMAKSLTATRDT